MCENKFYTPEEIKPLYSEIVPAYQAAFAGEPWNEVSKCADVSQSRCVGGLSAVAVGALCGTCERSITRPAYETDELTARFNELAATRPTAWYAEQDTGNLTMAAVAWKALPERIAREKYSDVPVMEGWIAEQVGGVAPIMWLDEVFANRLIRSAGNLRNFGTCVSGLARILECETVAYRTIAPQMVRAAQRDFEDAAVVYERGVDVPDRRNFVRINIGREQ